MENYISCLSSCPPGKRASKHNETVETFYHTLSLNLSTNFNNEKTLFNFSFFRLLLDKTRLSWQGRSILNFAIAAFILSCLRLGWCLYFNLVVLYNKCIITMTKMNNNVVLNANSGANIPSPPQPYLRLRINKL